MISVAKIEMSDNINAKQTYQVELCFQIEIYQRMNITYLKENFHSKNQFDKVYINNWETPAGYYDFIVS